tara:strand:- start:792 stop:1229 length:438 start_codon:yes stop_codon:yes gene_type:complete
MSKRKKYLLRIILGFFGFLLIGTVCIIWVLKKNDIKVFDSSKPEYQPLVSKNDERTPEFEKGLDLFLNDCKQCHVTKNKLHNYLDGIVDKRGKEFLKLYLTKQDSLIENEDELALAIKKEWGNQANNHNFKYSEKDLDFLMEYLK